MFGGWCVHFKKCVEFRLGCEVRRNQAEEHLRKLLEVISDFVGGWPSISVLLPFREARWHSEPRCNSGVVLGKLQGSGYSPPVPFTISCTSRSCRILSRFLDSFIPQPTPDHAAGQLAANIGNHVGIPGLLDLIHQLPPEFVEARKLRIQTSQASHSFLLPRREGAGLLMGVVVGRRFSLTAIPRTICRIRHVDAQRAAYPARSPPRVYDPARCMLVPRLEAHPKWLWKSRSVILKVAAASLVPKAQVRSNRMSSSRAPMTAVGWGCSGAVHVRRPW